MESNVKNMSVYTIPLRISDNSFNVSNISKRKKKYAKVKKIVTVDRDVSENKMPESEVVFQPALLTKENELNTQVSYKNDTFAKETPIKENITTNDTFVQETPITENITTNDNFLQKTTLTENITTNEFQTPLTEYQFGQNIEQYSINTENKLTEINPTSLNEQSVTDYNILTENDINIHLSGVTTQAESEKTYNINDNPSPTITQPPIVTQNQEKIPDINLPLKTEPTITKNVGTSYESDNQTLTTTTTSSPSIENPTFTQNITTTNYDNTFTTKTTDIPTTKYVDNTNTNDYDNLQNIELTTSYTVTENTTPTFNQNIALTTIENIGTTVKTDIPNTTTVTDIPTTTTFDNLETTTVTDMPNTTCINNAYTNDYNNLQNVGLKTSYTITDNTKPTINDIPTTTDFDNRNTESTNYENLKNIELTKSYELADNSMPTYNQNQETDISNIPYESNNINITEYFSKPKIYTKILPTITYIKAPTTKYNEYPTTTSFSIANQPITTLNSYPYKSANQRIDVTTSYDNVGSHNNSINSYRSNGRLSIPPGARTQTEIVPVEEIEYVPVKKKKFIKRTKVFVPTIKKVPIKKTIYVRKPREKIIIPINSMNSISYQNPEINLNYASPRPSSPVQYSTRPNTYSYYGNNYNISQVQPPLSPLSVSNTNQVERPLSPLRVTNTNQVQPSLSPFRVSNTNQVERPLSPLRVSNTNQVQPSLSPLRVPNTNQVQPPLSPLRVSNSYQVQPPLSPLRVSNSYANSPPSSPMRTSLMYSGKLYLNRTYRGRSLHNRRLL